MRRLGKLTVLPGVAWALLIGTFVSTEGGRFLTPWYEGPLLLTLAFVPPFALSIPLLWDVRLRLAVPACIAVWIGAAVLIGLAEPALGVLAASLIAAIVARAVRAWRLPPPAPGARAGAPLRLQVVVNVAMGALGASLALATRWLFLADEEPHPGHRWALAHATGYLLLLFAAAELPLSIVLMKSAENQGDQRTQKLALACLLATVASVAITL